MIRALMLDGKSTTIEAEEDEDPPEVIPEDDDDTLDDLHMPPNEADNTTSVQVDSDWIEICLENIFCTKGSKFFAFRAGYDLVLSVVGSWVTDCAAGHFAIY